MGLLLDAARSWEELRNISYIIEVGRRGTLERIELSFSEGDFAHLSGMHYAKDIDLGLRRSEYYGERLLGAVLDGRIDDQRIEKSRRWNDTIRGRLTTVTKLQEILDNPFKIVSFDKRKVRGYCVIDARFAIKSEITGEICFVFLDEATGRYYCRSAFSDSVKDYTENQSVMTVLRKVKTVGEASEVLYSKPGYVSEIAAPIA